MKSEVSVSKTLDQGAGMVSRLSVLGRAVCEPDQVKGAALPTAVLMPLQSFSQSSENNFLKSHFSVQNLQRLPLYSKYNPKSFLMPLWPCVLSLLCHFLPSSPCSLHVSHAGFLNVSLTLQLCSWLWPLHQCSYSLGGPSPDYSQSSIYLILLRVVFQLLYVN